MTTTKYRIHWILQNNQMDTSASTYSLIGAEEEREREGQQEQAEAEKRETEREKGL
jgi:hypothetical protein